MRLMQVGNVNVVLMSAFVLSLLGQKGTSEDALPFRQKVEVYCSEETDVRVFRLRLEQPFLAEEFEKSNYLRLNSADKRAYLVYPKETKFHQKHAEFFGRLRGDGEVSLSLSYEIVSENPDGTRRVEVREGVVKVEVPQDPVGSERIYQEWAKHQNQHFAHLLQYYPEESFYQYCLLQSRARYGVTPPPIPKSMPQQEYLETSLYQAFTGSLAIQESLQRQTLSAGNGIGDLTRHISSLKAPTVRSLNYDELLKERQQEEKVEPQVHEAARLVPHDQYLLHFNTFEPLRDLIDLSSQWGGNLLRLYTVRAQDAQVEAKVADQLCVQWDALTQLFDDKVVSELAVTGADPYLLEGTDVSMILRLEKPEVFEQAAQKWLDEMQNRHPQLVHQEFNYRGHKVLVHYTNDRVVSSFRVRHDNYAIMSNSHRAIRKIIDVAVELSPSLQGELDYRYVTTLLPPSTDANSGYFYASEAFIKRLIGPAVKISQKRRRQCFNNLVMLNNASLFYRLEHSDSPASLSELIEGGFVDSEKIVCPHGGSYAFDTEHDMCTCSLHNRLRYLTPNGELSVLKISDQEASEYDRYKKRYQKFWQPMFDPVAVRISVGRQLRLEGCVLPFANGSMYRDIRQAVEKAPRAIGTSKIAPTAVTSLFTVSGRRNIAQIVQMIPGVAEVLQADPTLTDLEWLGDRFALHFCDGETILQVDPTQLGSLDLPMVGDLSFEFQATLSAAVMATNVPVYVTIDVENQQHASRLLEQLSQQVFLKQNQLAPGVDVRLDAYRLPDYKDHAIYVFSGSLYVMKVRLHVALVGDQLVAATKPEILREVIDASQAVENEQGHEAHVLLRLNRKAVDRLYDDMQLYWAEKSRTACHRNIISIYNLCKLYDIPVDEVDKLAEAKYGVRYYCPDQGKYDFDRARDQVICSVHGNREHSRQNPHLERESSFASFIDSLDEIVAALRFEDRALIATVEITRSDAE